MQHVRLQLQEKRVAQRRRRGEAHGPGQGRELLGPVPSRGQSQPTEIQERESGDQHELPPQGRPRVVQSVPARIREVLSATRLLDDYVRSRNLRLPAKDYQV